MGSKVCAIMHLSECDIDHLCSRYTATVHRWFPVVGDVDALSQRSNGTANVDADTWMLFLSLHLIVQMYDRPKREDPSEIDRLYLTSKSLFSFISSCRAPTVEHIQSGLLIGLYEHCQALHEAAYLSIGVCARIGYLLGYDKSLSYNPKGEQGGDDMIHNQRRVWWCIIILERFCLCDF